MFFTLFFIFILPDLLDYHTIAADYRNQIVSLPPLLSPFVSIPRSSFLLSLFLSLSLPFFFFLLFLAAPSKRRDGGVLLCLICIFGDSLLAAFFLFSFFLLTRGFFVLGAFIFSLDPPDVDVVEQIIACTYATHTSVSLHLGANLAEQSSGPSLIPVKALVKGDGQRVIAVGAWDQTESAIHDARRTEEARLTGMVFSPLDLHRPGFCALFVCYRHRCLQLHRVSFVQLG